MDQNVTTSSKKMSIWAFVLSIVAFVTGLLLFISIPLAIVSLILAIMALVKHRPGKGLSIAAVIVSGLAILLIPVVNRDPVRSLQWYH